MGTWDRIAWAVDKFLAPIVAVGTLLFIAYLYLRGIEVPSELKVSAAAANAYVFRSMKGTT